MAEVNAATGLVTARGQGQATITATAQSASGSITIIVAQKPTQLEKVQGDSQTGTVGESVETNPRVRVRDSRSNPIQGAAVTFSVTEGGGSVPNSPVQTDAAGEAERR